MNKFKDNFSSESFYPDSKYYLDQDNNLEKTPLSENQISNIGENFEWPNTYWFITPRSRRALPLPQSSRSSA